ncbi:hypothetical protein, partial [Acetomicrobium sp. S15 = DSM 107314]|uniref:hypothetical protein n=1 Tax=Acetomicrobium sp. S15 = DSM 107314 TaxID=2529858 RepID=UPI0018E17089
MAKRRGGRTNRETYPIGLVPGPVSVPKEIRGVYFADFGSADLEKSVPRDLQSSAGIKRG